MTQEQKHLVDRYFENKQNRNRFKEFVLKKFDEKTQKSLFLMMVDSSLVDDFFSENQDVENVVLDFLGLREDQETYCLDMERRRRDFILMSDVDQSVLDYLNDPDPLVGPKYLGKKNLLWWFSWIKAEMEDVYDKPLWEIDERLFWGAVPKAGEIRLFDIRMVVYNVNRYFERCKKYGLIQDYSPWDGSLVKTLDLSNVAKVLYYKSEEEFVEDIRAYLANMSGASNSTAHYTAVMSLIFVWLGFSFKEMTAFKRKDLDEENGTFAGRPVHPGLLRYLSDYARNQWDTFDRYGLGDGERFFFSKPKWHSDSFGPYTERSLVQIYSKFIGRQARTLNGRYLFRENVVLRNNALFISLRNMELENGEMARDKFDELTGITAANQRAYLFTEYNTFKKIFE